MVWIEQTERREVCIRNFISIYHNNNTAAAGTLNDMDDGTSGNRVYLRRNADTERADEIITVSGDSMEPTFRDGDALLVEHTTEIRRGEIGIFVINGEGFVKEYRGDGVYSHNAEKYPFRKFLPDDDIRCIGRVLGKVRKDLLPTDEEKELLKD